MKHRLRQPASNTPSTFPYISHLQYEARLSPGKPKLGWRRHPACRQRREDTLIIPASLCPAQYEARRSPWQVPEFLFSFDFTYRRRRRHTPNAVKYICVKICTTFDSIRFACRREGEGDQSLMPVLCEEWTGRNAHHGTDDVCTTKLWCRVGVRTEPPIVSAGVFIQTRSVRSSLCSFTKYLGATTRPMIHSGTALHVIRPFFFLAVVARYTFSRPGKMYCGKLLLPSFAICQQQRAKKGHCSTPGGRVFPPHTGRNTTLRHNQNVRAYVPQAKSHARLDERPRSLYSPYDCMYLVE